MTKQEMEQIVLRNQAEQDWKEQASAAEIEEYERWKARLDKDYELELNRDRKKRNKYQDSMDITTLDRRNDEDRLDTSKALRITSDLDYLEIIFSQQPEDLYELVTDEAHIAAIKCLTSRQREALFHSIPPRTKTKDIAEEMGTSSRNILKHLAKAREKIINEIGELQ